MLLKQRSICTIRVVLIIGFEYREGWSKISKYSFDGFVYKTMVF